MESDNQSRKRKPRPPKTQDEKERHSKAAIRKKKSMPDIKAFLLRARHDRDFWASPLYEYALSHSSQFPIANSNSRLVDLQDRAPGLQVFPPLSTNFFEEITERTAPSSEAEPLVRVLSCDFSFESAPGYKKEQHGSVRRARLLLLDGPNKTVLLSIPVSNLLHAVKIHLTRGQPIIRLKNYNITEYNDSEEDDVSDFKPGILIV